MAKNDNVIVENRTAAKVIYSIPDAFIDEMINDAVTESGLAENLTDEVKQQLYDAPLSDWYKILKKAGITSNYSPRYIS